MSADGVPIRYEVEGTGEPALLFIHGWSCDRTYWLAQVAAFSVGRRVVTLDLAGHGESGRDRKAWTLPAFGADVRAVVEALDLGSVVLIGHSMGGPVALEAAQLMPERIAAVIGVDTLTHVGSMRRPADIPRALAPFRADYRATTDGMVRRLMFTPRSPRPLVEKVARAMAGAPPAVAVSVLETLYRYDSSSVLARVRVPIHLVNAKVSRTDLAAARRSAPQVRLTEMPGLGHFLMLEDSPAFNRVLGDVLSDVLTDGITLAPEPAN
jgi:pimeloyl-ACP methyl ester carboxylesterase